MKTRQSNDPLSSSIKKMKSEKRKNLTDTTRFLFQMNDFIFISFQYNVSVGRASEWCVFVDVTVVNAIETKKIDLNKIVEQSMLNVWTTKISIEADRKEKQRHLKTDWYNDNPIEIWFAKISLLTHPIKFKLGHLFFLFHHHRLRCLSKEVSTMNI